MISIKKWMTWGMALPLLFAACSDNVNNDYSDPDTGYDPDAPASSIVMNATLNSSQARAGATSIAGQWGEETTFSVFMQPKGGNLVKGTYSVKPATITNGGAYASFDGDLKWEKPNEQYGFYALYPVMENIADVSKVPMEVPAVQNQAGRSYDHVTAMDYNLAAPVITSSPGLINDPALNTPVELAFTHVLALHEYRFAAKGADTYIKINKVTVKDVDGKTLALSGSTLDMTTFSSSDKYASLDGGTGSDQITVNVSDSGYIPQTGRDNLTTNPGLPAPETVFPVSLVVLPSDHTSPGVDDEEQPIKNILITVEATVDTLDENQQVTGSEEKTFEIELVGNNYLRGYKYVTTIVIGGGGGTSDPGVPWDGSIAGGPTLLDMNEKVIEIGSASELAWLAAVVNKEETVENLPADLEGYTVILTRNINLNELEWTPIGIFYSSTAANNKTFKGTFDGGGFTVSGLKITQTPNTGSAYGYGLFGYARPCPAITNVIVKGEINVSANAQLNVGGVIGYIYGPSSSSLANISNCHFDGTITVSTNNSSSRIGGIVGNHGNANYKGCSASGEMTILNSNTSETAALQTAGIAPNAASHENCWNDMDINVTGGVYIGGILAYPSSGSVKGCKNSGNITVDAQSKLSSVGGIVGLWNSSGDIISCYNQGNITVTNKSNISSTFQNYDATGGVIGSIYGNRTIRGVYNTGTVTSSGGTNAAKVGSVAGNAVSLTNTSGVENNYTVETMGYDLNALFSGKITQFASGSWPTESMSGWGIGQGEDNKYWKDLGSSPSTYPVLWWE